MYIPKIQFNTVTKYNSYSNYNQNYSNHQNYNLKMSNPLAFDTVSFQGTPKNANKANEIRGDVAKKISRTLKPAKQKVEHFINTYFSDLVVSPKEPENPIYKIHCRLKSGRSIQEKSGTRQWLPQEILENMTDLIGAKFELRTSNKHDVESVLDRFITLIRSRDIELLEIENKRPGILEGLPENEHGKYDYASIKFLEKMIDAQEETWNSGQKRGARKQKVHHIFDDFTPMNYNAIHMLFRIPGKEAVVFELQIMGKDMASGKDIDDKVYKLLSGKTIDKKYAEIKNLFAPFTNKHFFDNEPNGKEILENAIDKYKKYRQEMFMFQREKEPLPYSRRKNIERFLPLQYQLFPSDIELRYGIHSSDFDYNNLYTMIDKADRKAERIQKAREQDSLITQLRKTKRKS